MASCEWTHFSCHGIINRDVPLQSHFALYDGFLSLLELMKQRLPYAGLAFLSVCYSAADDSKAPDEFLHLAGAMQFASFKSVIGTIWAMVDHVGPILTDEFYRRMLERKDSVPDHTESARALSGAVKVLRREQLPMTMVRFHLSFETSEALLLKSNSSVLPSVRGAYAATRVLETAMEETTVAR
ncbi:hypothetical protein FRB99_007618 [Tulasnella sp. 403]|nr:hypothetical protein FRB99_007618 [Tulasnella sp. 403]